MRRQVGTIPKTLEIQLEEGNYYEALQLYKSLQSRYESAKKFKESDELLKHGIENLNKHDQFISAYDLAVLYLNSLKTREASFTTEFGDYIIHILSTFPPSDEKEKLIGAFTSWCQNAGNNLIGYPKLNDFAGKYFWEQGKYSISNDYYIISENMTDFCAMLIDWSKHGYASEIDIFIVRPILWLISKQNLRDANKLFECAKESLEDDDEFCYLPLIHFCDFLLQTVTRNAPEVFNLLCQKYDSELKRDKNFDTLLKEIGRIYFNIRQQSDLFSNMMRMFAGM